MSYNHDVALVVSALHRRDEVGAACVEVVQGLSTGGVGPRVGDPSTADAGDVGRQACGAGALDLAQ
jgi:hypothetical protein